MQPLQQRAERAAALAIADQDEEMGTDGTTGERGPHQGGPQTKGHHHHHHPTRGRWSLQQLRSP